MQTLSPVGHRIETNLVVEGARTFLSGGKASCLHAALTQPVDWIAVERIADFHSVMPMLACVLKEQGGSLVPREILERLQHRFLLIARSNLVRLQEWRRILLAFETAGISVISLKGPALALQAYGDVALREFTDLDLLIRPDDVLKARDTLMREGYRLRFSVAGNDIAWLRSRNQQWDFVNEGRGTVIDLHWGALHGMFPFQLPVHQLFESAQAEHCGGIPFLSLSPELLLIYLCAHGTKHCWLTLRSLCDVACHVRMAKELGWELCIRQTEAAGCDLVLKHSLLLAQQVLGLELPSHIENYCDSAKARALADAASSLLFREDGNVGYGEGLRFHLGFAESRSNRARLMFERVFIPEEQDWQTVHLPHSLQFLYYAVRPIRFIVERLSKTTLQPRAEEWSAKELH